MFTLSEQDCEAQVREKIASTLKEKYSVIGPNDFEFVKVTQKRISVLHLSKQPEYNYDVVKKLVGQGLLYIRIKMGFEFVVNQNHASNSDSELLQVGAQETSTIPSNSNGTSGIVPAPPMELLPLARCDLSCNVFRPSLEFPVIRTSSSPGRKSPARVRVIRG